MIFVRSRGRFRVGRGSRGSFPNPSSNVGQLVWGGLSGELHGMDENGLFRSQRFIFPDEVDQVLRGVNELTALGGKLVVEVGSLGMGKHASVNANSSVLGTIDEPFDPVLGTVYVTGLDTMPILVELACGLDPVPRVGDEVGCGL